jgi:CRISPR-associated protein Cmr6
MGMEAQSMANKPKPVKRQKIDQPTASSSQPKIKGQGKAEQRSVKTTEIDPKDIPLMFQAQIEDRGNIQFVGEKKDQTTGQKSTEKPTYEQWVDQWLTACPPIPRTPTTQTSSGGMDGWQKALAKLAVVEVKPSIVDTKLPTVQKWEYQVSWRLVTNSGQDNFNRPVIGKQGMPFFPGSSMKGAFRHACPPELRMRYCGDEEETKKGEKRTKPGILRFHGGYPTNTEWRQQRDRLVDIAHSQENYQVRDSEADHNANVQISLYRPKLEFGISSTAPLTAQEWGEVKQIWEKALGYGLGSRVSAGYGYMEDIASSHPNLYSIYLNGWGLSSLLLLPTRSKTDEFRPNMFKAALRGHTWRLLAGITDEPTAQILTQKLWGGLEGSAVEGCVSINFVLDQLIPGEHQYQITKKDKKTQNPYTVTVTMPTYKLQNGRLDLLQVKEVKPELMQFLLSLVKFAMLLGGFGKSWRRINHKCFHHDYFKRGDKPMIGCHWEFSKQSEALYIAANQDDLSEIIAFLKEIREQVIAWVQAEGQPLNDYVKTWRETWHPNNVQVWGRVATNEQSQAVRWFHDEKFLKGTNLAGAMGQIGRIWHRMYPRYEIKDGKLNRLDKDYVELLTIFPDSSPGSQRFMNFLATEASQFKKLWPRED